MRAVNARNGGQVVIEGLLRCEMVQGNVDQESSEACRELDFVADRCIEHGGKHLERLHLSQNTVRLTEKYAPSK